MYNKYYPFFKYKFYFLEDFISVVQMCFLKVLHVLINYSD
jgi:hypothetical protein